MSDPILTVSGLGKRFGGKSFMITQEELDAFKKIPRVAGNPGFSDGTIYPKTRKKKK